MNPLQFHTNPGMFLYPQTFSALHLSGLNINLIIFSLQQYELEPVLHSDGLFRPQHDGQNP